MKRPWNKPLWPGGGQFSTYYGDSRRNRIKTIVYQDRVIQAAHARIEELEARVRRWEKRWADREASEAAFEKAVQAATDNG